jgi:hypothetical protein
LRRERPVSLLPRARRTPGLRGAAVAFVASALVASAARAAPPRSGPTDGPTATTPAAAPPVAPALALAHRKCASCHALPPAGSRHSGWAAASVSMHVRRVAMSPRDWALIREYLGVPR